MENRYLMWTLSTFVVTLFLCTIISIEMMVISALIIFLALIPLIFIRFSWKKLVLPCMAAFILAIGYYSWTDAQFTAVQKQLVDRQAEIAGEITDVGSNAAGNLRCYKIRLTEIEGEKFSSYQRVYINLYSDTEESYNPGTIVQGTVMFFETPIEFGAGREDRILLSSMSEPEDLVFEKALKKTSSAWLYEFRSSMQSRLSFGSEKTVGLLRSVCFGDTDSLDYNLNISLRRSGLTHVTAVSGLHLSFTVLLFNFIMISVGLHYRVRYILDIFVCVIFTVLVGFPLSCIRACIMMVLMCLAMAVNLFEDGLTSLSAAAFIIVLFNPYAVRDVGFLLSVTATAGIITMRLPIENFLFPKKLGSDYRVNWFYRKITGSFACSVAATIATLPIIIITFGSVSLIGPLANVLLIYPLQWIFMMGILMVMLGWIPGVGFILGWLCDVLYVLVDTVAELLGRMPFASVSAFSLSGVVALFLFLAIIGVGFYHYFAKQRRSTMPLLLLLICFSITFQFVYRTVHPDDHIEIAFIDVGQGDCTVISRGHSAVVLDYGGSSQKRYNLIEYLKKKNIYTVELLGFTHLHSDHTNGLYTLLNHVYVDQILYPEIGYENTELLTIIQSENGTEVTGNLQQTVLNDVQLSVMADTLLNESVQKENECCICYRVTFGDTIVLITGDLTGESELLLADQIGDTTILKVSHHGSDTSSLYPFIKTISPEISVISVGENTYGLPNSSVIDRLKTISCAVYQTMDEGTIVFKTDGKTVERIYK